MALGSSLMIEVYFGCRNRGPDRSYGRFQRVADQWPVIVRNTGIFLVCVFCLGAKLER
jgi:hypothetical protein